MQTDRQTDGTECMISRRVTAGDW